MGLVLSVPTDSAGNHGSVATGCVCVCNVSWVGGGGVPKRFLRRGRLVVWFATFSSRTKGVSTEGVSTEETSMKRSRSFQILGNFMQ